LLDNLDVGSMSPEVFKLLDSKFGMATNNTSCPCNSKKTYGNCCKTMWKTIPRQYANRDKMDRDQQREQLQQAKLESEMVRRTTWLGQLGQTPEGMPVFRPNDDLPPAKRPHLPEICGLLLQCYHICMMRFTMQTGEAIINGLAEQMRSAQSAPPPSMGGFRGPSFNIKK